MLILKVKKKYLFLILFLLVCLFFGPKEVKGGCGRGSALINNCPSGTVTSPYTIEATLRAGRCTQACGKADYCTMEGEGCVFGKLEYRVNNGSWIEVEDWKRISKDESCTCNPPDLDCTIQGQ